MKREVRFIGGHYQGETSWFGVSLSLVDSLDWILFYGGGGGVVALCFLGCLAVSLGLPWWLRW